MGLRDNVERWLVHESYVFKETKNPDASFQITVKHVGTFGNPLDIFEPKNQPNVLVLGSKVPFKNNQIIRYRNLTQEEKERFEKKVADYCYSIQAVYRFFVEDGKNKVGVYIVLDKEEQLNQIYFVESLQRIAEMSDKTNQFLMKTF